jgi:hypothetical protein
MANHPSRKQPRGKSRNGLLFRPFDRDGHADPPEPIVDPWCPLHGSRDPDREYDEWRDRQMEGRDACDDWEF